MVLLAEMGPSLFEQMGWCWIAGMEQNKNHWGTVAGFFGTCILWSLPFHSQQQLPIHSLTQMPRVSINPWLNYCKKQLISEGCHRHCLSQICYTRCRLRSKSIRTRFLLFVETFKKRSTDNGTQTKKTTGRALLWLIMMMLLMMMILWLHTLQWAGERYFPNRKRGRERERDGVCVKDQTHESPMAEETKLKPIIPVLRVARACLT